MGQAALKLEAKGELLSKAAIAKRCKINVQTLTARLDDLGYEPESVNARGPNEKLYRFDDEMEFAVKSAKDSLSAAKIRDVRATYQLKELKLAEARSELVPMADCIERVQLIVSSLYKEFAVQQAKRLGRRLAKTRTVPEVVKVLKLDSDRVFDRLRENDEEFIPKLKK